MTETTTNTVEAAGKTVDSFIGAEIPWLQEQFFGNPAWSLIALPLLLLLAAIISGGLTTILCKITTFISSKRSAQGIRDIFALVRKPLRIIVAVFVFSALKGALPLTQQTNSLIDNTEMFINVIAVVLLLFGITNYGITQLKYFLETHGKRAAVAVLPLLRKLAKSLIAILALLFMLQNFGYDVAAIIAGLGIGGVAIALASQKSVENLLGGVMMVLDQPVRVGDFCKYDGERVGTVEDIGLRSTRVRSLDRTLVTVPNADMSQMVLENYASRDKMLMKTVLGVVYETTSSQMQEIIANVRSLLLKDTRVDDDPARVRFNNFGASSLDIEVVAYILTNDYNTFLEIQEELYLKIMAIVENAGSGFAFPSRTVYTVSDSD